MPIIKTQFPASVSVTNLNGVNGFTITGFPASSEGGYSVSGVGDVNADGITDLVVGAPYASSQTGMSYVIFGKSGLGSSGSLSVSSLTGSNGFAITGFPSGSYGGLSVSKAGDVNADGITDLVVGAPYASSNTGVSYIIFGKSGLGSTGSLSVSSLTGSNGFVITGFPSGSWGGWSVSRAGDVNDDGIADLVVGATYASSQAGMSYVIFGKSGLGSSGSLSVSSLTGSNGFAITGFPASSQGGWSVSAAGDVNSDGIADLVVGAFYASSYTGIGYVIFGKSGLGSSGSISVSSLTGSNGFAITGFPSGSTGGCSVSGAGDVNNDGIADLVIGAPYYTGGGAGLSYVIFGSSGLGSSGSIDVSNLTGSNGFVITGFPTSSWGGFSVSGAGDVNNDEIADLLVGAPYASNTAGMSYVIFGKVGLGSSGSLSISNLTGSNGFVITGFSAGSESGRSVSVAGDVNNDGIADLVVGAPYDSIAVVIFGEPTSIVISRNQLTINEGQTLTLSNQYLNATNFKNPSKDLTLQFTLSGIQHGNFFIASNSSVSLTSFLQQQVRSGQIQFAHDGSGWAPAYNASVGYAGMFATTIPQAAAITFQQSFVLVNNNLTVNQGQTVILTISNLSANDLYNSANNPNLVFSISNVQHGYFALTSASTIPITSFTQAQVQSGNVQFVQDGSANSPSYSVTVINGIKSLASQPATITFTTLALVTNTLTINQGQTVVLSTNNLYATSTSSSSFTFTVSNIQHGYFALTSAPTTPITSFTQAQVQSDTVQFVHDGTSNPPTYSITVSDGSSTSSAQAAAISFDVPPTITANTLTINQGQTVVFSSTVLSASDPYTTSFTFTVSNVQHGYFALISAPSAPITTFTQAQIQSGNVQFVQDGTVNPPSYSATVSDGRMTSITQAAVISFNVAPTLSTNILTVNQGQTVVLTSSNLSATPSTASTTYIVSNLQHGYFALSSAPSSSITSFTQAQLQNGNVQFVQDGTSNPPSYEIAAANGQATSSPQAATISFDVPPTLTANTLTLYQAETLMLSSSNLSASDPYTSSFTFTVSQVQHGYFAFTGASTTAVTSFTQAQIDQGVVQFVHDGSASAPSYSISVSDGRMSSAFQAGVVTFSLAAPPVLVRDNLSVNQGQPVILSVNDLNATDTHYSSAGLTFTVSDAQHGYFAILSSPNVIVIDPGSTVTSFTQSQVSSGLVEFIPDGGPLAPSYSVSVSNGYASTTPAPAAITFIPSVIPTSNSSSNTVRNSIIGGTVSGVIGLFFLVAKLYLTSRAAKNLQKTLEGGETEVEKEQMAHYKDVVRPIVNKIFEKINTTYFLGYRSDKDAKAYVEAIEKIITKLDQIGVDLNLKAMKAIQRSDLINEIAKQTRKLVVGDRSCCSTATLYSFFKPEATPQQIEDQANTIAKAVQKVIGGNKQSSDSPSSHSEVEMSDVRMLAV